MYNNFNISAWHIQLNSHSLKIPAIARIQNALIAALNEYPHLPKYIIVIPDKDILQLIEQEVDIDNGIKKAIFDNLCWLMLQFGRNLVARCDDLGNKRNILFK